MSRARARPSPRPRRTPCCKHRRAQISERRIPFALPRPRERVEYLGAIPGPGMALFMDTSPASGAHVCVRCPLAADGPGPAGLRVVNIQRGVMPWEAAAARAAVAGRQTRVTKYSAGPMYRVRE